MSGGAYSALSGMRARLEDLDRLASDLANVGTSGYKTERGATVAAERPSFGAALDAAIDVTGGGAKVDFRPGVIGSTGRDLDAAIEGPGFFVLKTPAGDRYTRSGSFMRRADGVLALNDGSAVMGVAGEIKLGKGAISIGDDGTIRVDEVTAGQLKVVTFAEERDVQRESGVRFKAIAGAAPPVATTARIVGGSLEQANVSMVDRMASLTDLQRGFEALQKGVSVLMNEVDGRAISELGRR